MFINSISAKNFGCIDNIDATFDKINLVMGDNGSGKSKFLSTIVYSLCDYLDQKIGDYVQTGSDKFEIDMKFNHVSNNYRIQIEGNKNGSSKLLTVNGAEEFKNSAVVEYIKKYIHNPKLTLASSITMQGQGSDILFEPNQKRVERLKQIFNIDKLNDVGLYIKEQTDALKLEIKELEVEIKTLDSTKYNFKPLCDKPDEKLLSQLKLNKANLEKEKVEYEKNYILFNNYVSDLCKYDGAQINIKEENNKILKLNTDMTSERLKFVSDLDDIETLRDKKSLLTENMHDIKDSLFNLDSYNKVNTHINKLTMRQTNIILKKLPRKMELTPEIKKELVDVSTELSVLLSRKTLVEEGKCDRCGQVYDLCGSVEEYNSNIKELTDKKLSLEDSINQIENSIEVYNEIENFNTNLNTEKTLIQEQIDKASKELSEIEIINYSEEELKNNLKISEDSYIILDEKIKESKILIEANRNIEDNIKTFQNNIAICQNNINNYELIEKPVEVIEPVKFNDINYTKICFDLDTQETLLSEYDIIISFNKMLEDMQITNNKKMESSQKQLDEKRNICKLKEETKKIIEKDFSSWLIDKGSLYVKNKMNEFFQKGYGKFVIDLISEDKSVDFFYSEDSENFLNVGMASGYEKEVLAISFRIALCSMQPVGLLLLDEVDSFSQVSNSLRLYQAILQEKDFEQIIAITHYPETSDYLMSEHNANVINLS